MGGAGGEKEMTSGQHCCTRCKVQLGSHNIYMAFKGKSFPQNSVGVGFNVSHCSAGNLINSGNSRSGRSKGLQRSALC